MILPAVRAPIVLPTATGARWRAAIRFEAPSVRAKYDAALDTIFHHLAQAVSSHLGILTEN